MSWSRFKTHVSGKWILAGEHSVLRGETAVAIPHSSIGLTLSFEPNQEIDFRVEPETATILISELIHSVADSWEADGRSFKRPKGRLGIESNIPIGAGL